MEWLSTDPEVRGDFTAEQAAFVDRVMARLPSITDPRDHDIVQLGALQQMSEGWAVDEVVAFARCLEEVSPGLAETVALARMHIIKTRVKERLGKR